MQFSAGTSAPLIEPQSAWNVRLNSHTRVWTYYSAESNTQMGRRMHQNTHFEAQKGKKIRYRALPFPRPLSQWGGDTPSHTPPPYSLLSTQVGPLFLILRRLTCPQPKSWIRRAAVGLYTLVCKTEGVSETQLL